MADDRPPHRQLATQAVEVALDRESVDPGPGNVDGELGSAGPVLEVVVGVAADELVDLHLGAVGHAFHRDLDRRLAVDEQTHRLLVDDVLAGVVEEDVGGTGNVQALEASDVVVEAGECGDDEADAEDDAADDEQSAHEVARSPPWGSLDGGGDHQLTRRSISSMRSSGCTTAMRTWPRPASP